jgi:hypothetical protein
MTTAEIGAPGRVGREIVRGILARGEAVAVLVRDPDRARCTFGEPDGLHIRRTRLDDPGDLPRHLVGSARCSSRWDQSGSRASSSGSRLTPPPEPPRSSRSPASRCSTPRRTHLGSTSEPTTASTSSPPRPATRRPGSSSGSMRLRRGSTTRRSAQGEGPTGGRGSGPLAAACPARGARRACAHLDHDVKVAHIQRGLPPEPDLYVTWLLRPGRRFLGAFDRFANNSR